MKQLLKQAALFLTLGSVMFLLSCNPDEDTVDAPVASFTATPNGATVTISNTTTGDGTITYEWDFDNGTESTAKDPTPVTYSASGTYTITLTATNEGGSNTTTQDVTVDVTAGANCTEETGEVLSADGFNLNFQTDPTTALSVVSENTTLTRIANPDSDNEVNSSCFVGQVTRTGEALFDNNQFTVDAKLDFNGSGAFTMKAWSAAAGTTVTVKLEDAADAGINTEKTVTMTKQGEWEDLTFSFVGADDKYDKIVLFFDLNTNNDFTYFFDDLALVAGDGSTPACTEETAESLSAASLNVTFQTDPETALSIFSDNASYARIANPGPDEVNGSCNIAQVIRTGATVFDNTQLTLDGKLNFNANGGLKIKVWSSGTDTKVTVKLEDSNDSGINTEQTLTMTKSSAWEELTYNFVGQDDKFDKIIIFFDLGANSTGTYYFDDLAKFDGDGVVPQKPSLPLDFESDEVTYSFTDFEGGVVTRIDNPDATGENTSAKVAQMVKGAGAVFAGSGVVLDAPIDFSTNKLFKMKVWSPRVGAKVLLKVENSSNGGIFFEKEATTTVASQWEVLEFDYSTINTANSYDKFTWIFDNGTAGDGSANFTFYFDDIVLEEGAATGGGVTEYCGTEVKNNGIEAETASAINLTIENAGANSMTVSITSADSDPVDVLIVNAFGGPVTGSPAISAADDSVAGTLTITLTWNDTPPAEIDLNILWSKDSFAGNWQLGTENTTVAFDATCN